MAKIKKIQESGQTIYPATIFQAVKDPKNGQTLDKSFESEHKKLTAGFAYEILGDSQATSEKFSFRPTGGPNRNVRDGSARIDVLKGNSVVWNQGIKPSSTQTTAGGLTGYYADGKWNWSGTANRAAAALLPQYSWGKGIAGHKVIMLVGGNYNFDSMGVVSYAANENENFQINEIHTLQNDSSDIEPVAQLTIGNTYQANISVHLIDLTQMFGAGNEPKQFYELLPEVEDINAYSEGEIVDANYKAIKTTGFNQWDEQWRTGEYNSTTGEYIFNQASIANTNPIRVISGCNYYVKLPENTDMVVFMYDYDMTYIGTKTIYSTLSIPANVSYINFRVQSSYGLTYKNDISINIAWDEYSALNGTYKPYKPFERDLSWVAKYFPNGMRSAGNVADEIRFNSTTQQWEAVQRVGVVDLGSLTWDYIAARKYFIAYVGGMYIPSYNFYKGFLCSKYIQVDFSDIFEGRDLPASCFGVPAHHNQIGVSDATYTDAAAFKAAMAGVMLNYELAEPIVTPITEDINLAYDVADYGTEQLIVAEGAQSAPLSAEVVYEPNVLASIKQVAAVLTRLDALETAVATMQASAVVNTNEE